MTEYKVEDISIYSKLVSGCNKVAYEFLLQNMDKKNKWIQKNVNKTNKTYCFGFCNKNILVIEENLYDNLIEEVINMLEKNGFHTKGNNDKNSIEIIYVDAENYEVVSDLVIHRDNDAYIYRNVQTLILYLQADCIGGNLDIFEDSGLYKYNKLESIIPYTKNILTRRVIMMNGNTFHKPTTILKGKRIAIVFNIEV